MDDLLNFLGFIFIVLGVAIYSILNWYRNKELQALKTIDLQIMAAENDLHFEEDGKEYLEKLAQFELQPGSSSKIKNIVKSYKGPATIRVFEATQVVGSGKSTKTIDLVGLTIESHKLRLPWFMLKTKMAFDGFTLFSDISKLETDSLPILLQRNCSLFHSKWDEPNVVENLFAANSELSELLDVSGFYMFAGSKDRLVFYQAGSLKSDLSHFRYMELKGFRLFDLFCVGPKLLH